MVQLNEIPAGTLDHYWGDVAVVVATEASGGVNDVIKRQTQPERPSNRTSQHGAGQQPGAQNAAVRGQAGTPALEGQRSGVEPVAMTTSRGPRSMKIVACNANRPLAEAVACTLNLPLTKASIRRFADMEVFVEIQENVRGEDVFVMQPTSFPANDNLMELLITLDALRRSSARRVTAVIPYFGYARQDRKTASRSPISAKLVANLITEAGANRVLTMDLHAAQIQGFFDIPVDNLYAEPLYTRDIQERYKGRDIMIVSPDVGGVVRARAIATRLNCDLAIIDKRRERAGHSEVMNVIGDVHGPRLHPGRRHGRFRRHALQRRRCADRARRAVGRRLCHAWRAVGRRGGADRVLADRDDDDHRLDPGDRGGAARRTTSAS